MIDKEKRYRDVIADLENEIGQLKQRNTALLEALHSLLDGLDANYDERLGLTNDEWQELIKDARQAATQAEGK